ncbi:TerC/Alx family metal homeostasis membrane protein [Candidatus Magnetomonas plexicatena]|uniref:TerC/Alx family metal homeostasis membrane protein n=1 Tax=Candidatus Magnetomonas plexicatena TaxID=2552947 RepID=UPI0011012BA4|nr:TerC/Alx family metal homeostasis membrane protein [Nitrospirales bacterium LBB_01]
MLFGYSVLTVVTFIILIIVSLVIDLYSSNSNKPLSFKNAAVRSSLWIFLSLGFALFIAKTNSIEKSLLFISGYLIELSLSVDNLFVFMAIFSSFSIKNEYQHRILYYGILGAIVFRIVFIAIGTSLILLGKWVLAFFGIFVIWTAWQMYRHMDTKKDVIVDYSGHWSVKLARRFFRIHHHIKENEFFTKIGGFWHLTPMFLCLIVIEIADLMFAIDSVPAVIAITQDPFLVYTSNIFAILGLRSMYFMLVSAKGHLVHLEKSVIAILFFVGVKMLLDVFNVIHIIPNISLMIVFILLMSGIIFSLTHPNKHNTPKN